MHKSKEQTEAIVKQCAEENNLSWDDINTCLTDGTVDALLFANEEREQFIKPKVFGVPDIRFYDIFNMDLMMAARENLVATICNLINGTKPSACDEEFLNVKNLKKPKTC
ncbi:unnamed protein product [Psylliodes chrysocephalus]|uniref:Uncharacterized protein n=1 Tax=Psylliodes chrysocephalus TaxID=3402493 RepID=A0A9P0CJD7_9CUCU|nr:unnamed protein product [Psylliodes chrysocephala]